MAYICENCGKTIVYGRSQRHRRGVAGKRWKKRAQVTPRLFKANIQTKRLFLGGEVKKVKICTKCLKRYKKESPVEKDHFGSVLENSA